MASTVQDLIAPDRLDFTRFDCDRPSVAGSRAVLGEGGGLSIGESSCPSGAGLLPVGNSRRGQGLGSAMTGSAVISSYGLSNLRQGKRVPKLEPVGRLSREQGNFVEHFG
jgi:hypothetical protein